MKIICFFVFLLIAYVASKPDDALPADADPVISKLGGDQRYMPMSGDDGVVHMVDTWLKASDIQQSAGYQPDTENIYHLFTRKNPTVSQQILLGSSDLLASSNYNSSHRSIFTIHGWNGNVLGNFNSMMIPASLNAQDVNVFAVDWSAGAGTNNYIAAVINTSISAVVHLAPLERLYYQVDYRYIELLKSLYENATMSVRLQDQNSKPMPLQQQCTAQIAYVASKPDDALPADADPVISKLGGDQRYMPMSGDDGVVHMVDTWLKASDIQQSAGYQPDTENIYHLFTRKNPTVSQQILLGSSDLLASSNYNSSHRSIFTIHGWNGNVLGNFNSMMIPASLNAQDVNVFAVDWSAGAGTNNYIAAVINTSISGRSVARFVNWLMNATGTTPKQFHLVGHSLGGHQSGIIGRNVNGNVSYITALDPALPGWIANTEKFQPNDGEYTEVIHTNAGIRGYIVPLGHVDYYPNGGIGMPGCNSSSCDHERCFHYLAESFSTGGFTGTKCATYIGAMAGTCVLSGTLQMGGLIPKTGNSGIFYLKTNAASPFSRG